MAMGDAVILRGTKSLNSLIQTLFQHYPLAFCQKLREKQQIFKLANRKIF